MDDRSIVALYWQRNERAIEETVTKYGKYLYSISYQILSTFLGKITRRNSIDLWRKHNAEKRGGGEIALVLDELEECVSGNNDVESEIERQELQKKINVFLMGLPRRECHVFICRYWYMNSISDIAKQFNYSESKIKSLLFRTRDKLRIMLEKEGY